MKIEHFEDIEAWKESRILFKEVHLVFNKSKDYSFRDQIQRAALSVMTNIAEGFDRGSNKEFIQFLIIARGSTSEVRSLLYAGADVGYIDTTTFTKLHERCMKLTNLINGFIRYLRNSDRKN
jgi:four helix bundle protein